MGMGTHNPCRVMKCRGLEVVSCVSPFRFQQAMALVGGEFVANVRYLHNVWWPARKIVEEAVLKRNEVGVGLIFDH